MNLEERAFAGARQCSKVLKHMEISESARTREAV
jgi:hypothetical protein